MRDAWVVVLALTPLVWFAAWLLGGYIADEIARRQYRRLRVYHLGEPGAPSPGSVGRGVVSVNPASRTVRGHSKRTGTDSATDSAKGTK